MSFLKKQWEGFKQDWEYFGSLAANRRAIDLTLRKSGGRRVAWVSDRKAYPWWARLLRFPRR